MLIAHSCDIPLMHEEIVLLISAELYQFLSEAITIVIIETLPF